MNQSKAQHPFAPFVRILGRGKQGSRSLTQDEAYQAMSMIVAGEVEPLQLGAFLMLYLLGGMKSYRLRTRRHAVEMEHLDIWLTQALAVLPGRYDLAVELIKCRRLIKGYSDTHARGLSKFGKVMHTARLLEDRADAAEWVARLREAALQDAEGKALDGAIKTVHSFV